MPKGIHLRGRTGDQANRTAIDDTLFSIITQAPTKGRSKKSLGISNKELADLTGLTENQIRNAKNPAGGRQPTIKLDLRTKQDVINAYEKYAKEKGYNEDNRA